MSEKIGIVAYSFGLSEVEPNSANRSLAFETEKIRRSYPGSVLVAQWEIALGLEDLGITPDRIVNLSDDGTYLGTEDVWEEAVDEFESQGVTDVIAVAHPFLHIIKARRLVKRSGIFNLVEEKIANPGFPENSLQWWTRGPAQLIVYTAMQKLVGYQPSRQELRNS